MFKNLLKKNMIVIYGVALLISGIVVFSIIKSSSSTSSFAQSGYVHVDVNEDENKRVLFSAGSKYKNAVNSQIKFNDSANVERKLAKDNFMHYDDNSIAAFTDGVIVNVDELTAETSTMNHFHIAPGMILTNTGSSYTAENTGVEIDFEDFLWKISENKYLAVSKSVTAHLSDTDERDCGTYAEVTYLDGKVISIQTEDNAWQTISDDCKLILNDGKVIDLSMKNIQDSEGNVLLDFSRIILGSNDNIELTPLSDEMESVNDNTIPRFTVNNTPGDSGPDGTSGIIGLTGVDGLAGNKGKQGEDGLSDDKRGDAEGKQFPVFSVMNWTVGPTSCMGDIFVEDESEVLITNDNSGSGLTSLVYLVDLDTGENIPVPDSMKPNAYHFAEIRNNTSSSYHFEFSGLKTDHSYMLYVSAPIQMSEESNPYSRGFVSKSFWTDSIGVYLETGNVDSDNYDIVVHNSNIYNGMGIYTLKHPFEDYDKLSSLTLSDLTGDKYKQYIYQSPEQPIWTVTTSDLVTAGVHTLNYSSYLKINPSTGNPEVVNGLKSDTYYYTLLLYDTDGNGSIDDYSTQILSTQTLKKRPTVTAPSISTNKTIGGFDITPGIVNDVDGAVTKYAVEFYNVTSIKDYTDDMATSAYVLKEGAEPVKTVYLTNNSGTSVSLGGINLDNKNYVVREVLTVFDNEKDYMVYSNFSNKAQLEESLTPYVYFEPLGQVDPGSASPFATTSPYYDSIVGILHVYPGAESYMYAINEHSLIEIQGDSYTYNFGLKDATSSDLPTASEDLAKLPAIRRENGEVEIYLMDYQGTEKSWASGLKAGHEYYMTVYGSLYDDIAHPDQLVSGKEFTTVGKCAAKTPVTQPLHMVMSTSPSSPNLLKGLRAAIATPNQLNNNMNIHINSEAEPNNEAYYNRQLDTLYGFTVSVYKNDHSQKYAYLETVDTKIIVGKEYFVNEGGNFYTKVDDATLADKTLNPSNEGWYEYKEKPIPAEDLWFTKVFTKNTPYVSGTGQVYKLYDVESINPQLRNGVQVVGVPRQGETNVIDYVMSSGGVIPDNPDNYTYAYINYTYNTGTGKYDYSNAVNNRISSQVVEGKPNRYTLRPLFEISTLFESDIEKNRNSSSDYIVSDGGYVFKESDFSYGGKTLEQLILGDDGIIKNEGIQGITIVIDNIFDYTYNNPADISTAKQNGVRVLTTDRVLSNPVDKVYYRKRGTMYQAVNLDELNPYDLGLYVVGASGDYELTTDTALTSTTYYYFYDGSYFIFDPVNINPQGMGWYVNADSYINYFENAGKDRIYISFSRSVGDIDVELPYTEVNGLVYKEDAAEGKIVRRTVSEADQYHYYYNVQANYTNANQLADSITYRIYDSVDFYNTLKHKNNDSEYINWALLGRDPRSTNPNDIFTGTWLMKDIQTTGSVANTEYVYHLIQATSSTMKYKEIKPYLYGWYEKVGTEYVLTDDVKIAEGTTYYLDNGTATPTALTLGGEDDLVSPYALHWYQETIEPASSDTSIDTSKTYYAKKNNAGEVEYSMINTEDISPIGLSWYEEDPILGKQLSNDTAINTDKTYYYYTGSGNNYGTINLSYAEPGNVNPSQLGWCYGNKISVPNTKTTIASGDRLFIKYAINVHTTDNKYINNSGYAHYDTTISPATSGYQEYAKSIATTSTIQPNTRYYSRYLDASGKVCYTLVDLNANENRNKNPISEGWVVDGTTKVASNDRYLDTQKEYFNASGTSIYAQTSIVNPNAKGWYEKGYVLSTDTAIDYSKRYYVKEDATTYTRVNPNINPEELKWAEYAKTEVGNGVAYNSSDATVYYAKVGENYVLVSTNAINPKAIKWYEGVKKLSVDGSLVNTKKYYERVLDENWNESYVAFPNAKADVHPKDLKWREYDSVAKEKVITTDNTIDTSKTYYIPVGKKSFVEYDGSENINPGNLQLFEEVKVLSNDVKANKKKNYYFTSTSTTSFTLESGFKIGTDGAGWYKDNTASKILTADQSFDESKTYFASTTSTTTISTNFSPAAFGWYEEGWVLTPDTDMGSTKEYAVRYITNINASSSVTTQGLELAKTTLKFNGSTTPSIVFYPCTEAYARAHYSVNNALNNVFFPDDSFEELYGHQFIITWTLNYHGDDSVDWHYVYPFDANAKLQQEGGTGGEIDKTFIEMAEEYAGITLSSKVLGFYDTAQAAVKLPNGENTKFGKNAYMAIPHNYIELDEPKKKPTAYALQWDSGKEESGETIPVKYVTTRSILMDPYNAVFNHKANNDADPFAYAGAYIVGDTKSLVDMRINNTPAETMTEAVAVSDIINAKLEDDYIITVGSGATAKKYAVSEIKVTNKDDTHGYINSTAGAGIAGSIPVVAPVQLYSNKYVKQRQSLHIAPANTYVTGSSDTTVGTDGTDSNWKFNGGTTAAKDKYAPLFTAVFNKDSDVVTSTTAANTSTLKFKTKVVNQEITGYDMELITSPEVLKDVVGVRLTFEICDYRPATETERTDVPNQGGKEGLGVFETIPSKSETNDTTAQTGKKYYYNVGIQYKEFCISGGASDVIKPNEYNWYEKPGADYVLTDDTSYEGDKYYFESEPGVYTKIESKAQINPKAMGWFEDTYNDVKWTTDATVIPGKNYLYQTDDVLYTMTIDKYLPSRVAENDGYSQTRDGVKMLEYLTTDSKVHMYFALGAEELNADPDYGITSSAFANKQGIRVYAEYLYESDKAGYSHVKVSSTGPTGASDQNFYSSKADSVINNKESGAFAIRKHTLVTNDAAANSGYYFTGEQGMYLALSGNTSAETGGSIVDNPTSVYTVQNKEVVPGYNADKPYTISRFGSFFSVGSIINATDSDRSLMVKTTRYQTSPKTQIFDVNAAVANNTEVYVPAVLETRKESKIEIQSWKNNSNTASHSFGIIEFPKSSLYIDFENGTTNDGAAITRQSSKLNYVVCNADSTHQIYALLTIGDIVDVNIDPDHRADADGKEFVSSIVKGSGGKYTLISNFNGDTEIVPKISTKAIYKTMIGAGASDPSYYFSHIHTGDDGFPAEGYKYEDLFIPIKNNANDNTNGITLDALPYAGNYSVSFWVWSLINETAAGSEYGWVCVPYSNTKERGETIDFATGEAPKPAIKDCLITYGKGNNHLDGYNNKTLTVNLQNTAADLYYVVELLDNSTGTPTRISHLFAAEGVYSTPWTFDIDGLKDTGASEYSDRLVQTGTKLSKLGQGLGVDDTATSDYTSFRYGKTSDGKDRYTVKLRAYLKGTGPAIKDDPNTYDWDNDPDSVYKVYKYNYNTTDGIKKDTVHVPMTQVPDKEKSFSINNTYDALEKTSTSVGIHPENRTHLVRHEDGFPENGPSIRFIVNKPDYHSYSLEYEQYIPVIVWLDKTGVAHNITEEVFSDLNYGAKNKKLGEGSDDAPTVNIGGTNYYIFDYDTPETFEFTADIKTDAQIWNAAAAHSDKKITNYGFETGDTIQIFLFSYQDEIQSSATNNFLTTNGTEQVLPSAVSITNTRNKLGTELQTLFGTAAAWLENGRLYPSTPYSMCHGEDVPITGLRMVSAVNTTISTKLIKFDPVDSKIKGSYTPEQIQDFTDWRNAQYRVDQQQQKYNQLLVEENTAKEALAELEQKLAKAKLDTEKEKYVNDNFDAAAKVFTQAGVVLTQDLIDSIKSGLEGNYQNVVVNPIQMQVDAAAAAYGHPSSTSTGEVWYVEDFEWDVGTNLAPQKAEGIKVIAESEKSTYEGLGYTVLNAKGKSGDVEDAREILDDLIEERDAIKPDWNRYFDIYFGINSESTGDYGKASVSANFLKGDTSSQYSRVWNNRQVTINSVKTDGYQCKVLIPRDELHNGFAAENSCGYNRIELIISFIADHSAETEIILSDKSANQIIMQEIEYVWLGDVPENPAEDKVNNPYIAKTKNVTWYCDGSSVANNNTDTPSVTFVFKK